MCGVGCREGAEEQEGEEEVLVGVCGMGFVCYGGGGYGEGEVAVCGCESLGFVREDVTMYYYCFPIYRTQSSRGDDVHG